MGIPGIFLLYFPLFNTVASKQILNINFANDCRLQTSGVGSDLSTNWATTLPIYIVGPELTVRWINLNKSFGYKYETFTLTPFEKPRVI